MNRHTNLGWVFFVGLLQQPDLNTALLSCKFKMYLYHIFINQHEIQKETFFISLKWFLKWFEVIFFMHWSVHFTRFRLLTPLAFWTSLPTKTIIAQVTVAHGSGSSKKFRKTTLFQHTLLAAEYVYKLMFWRLQLL